MAEARSTAAQPAPQATLVDGCVGVADLDANGHMNVARYTALFDQALEAWITRHLDGLLPPTSGVFVLEAHYRYERELREGAGYAIRGRLIAADDKRAHFILRMDDQDRGQRAASAEILVIHVDMDSRRAAPWPAGPPPESLARAPAAEHGRARFCGRAAASRSRGRSS
ncbi:MAG: hypothetical protein KatS3mg119_1780 [Rhodothalassiaceae bacterium]|nr:MAG: hypothetical protein KatS3mg119_1780 [Rhodothalassiaceae bacterium]